MHTAGAYPCGPGGRLPLRAWLLCIHCTISDGLPRLCYGSLQPSPDTLTRFKGTTSKGREGREGKRDGREERKKKRAGERGGEVRLPHSKFLDPPLAHRSLTVKSAHCRYSSNVGIGWPSLLPDTRRTVELFHWPGSLREQLIGLNIKKLAILFGELPHRPTYTNPAPLPHSPPEKSSNLHQSQEWAREKV